jgi:type IV pilus assembly protein PilA
MNKKQKGFSLIELLIVVAIILIIAAIAIPNLLRSRMAANEASAVGSLRTMNTANATYLSVYGGAFANTLDMLGGATTAAPVCGQANLVDSVLGTAPYLKSGYTFVYVGDAAGPATTGGGCTTTSNTYTINANPAVPGSTGTRYFFTDQSGVIRGDTVAATVASPPLQ